MKYQYSKSTVWKMIILLIFSVSSLNAQTIRVPANDPNIAFRGLMYADKSADSVVLNRFHPTFWKIATANYDSVKGKTQPGIVISFKTSSPLVVVNFKKRINTNANPSSWGIYKNGVSQGYKTSFPLNLTSGTTAPTTWDIVLPYLYGVHFTGLDLQSGYTTLPLEPEIKKHYIAIGNSITHGNGQMVTPSNGYATASDSSYAFILAKNMSWRLYNMAVAGSSITPLIADQTNPAITNVSADVITILWGYNDWNGNKSMVTLSSTYQTLLTKLRGYHPNAQIYCIMPIFTTTLKPTYGGTPLYGAIDTLRNTQRRVVNKLIAAGDKKMFVIEGSNLTNATDLYDVVHLNTKGAVSFAQNLTTIIQQIEVSSGLKELNSNSNIKIYPNPVTGKTLHINLLKVNEPSIFSIVDLTGKIVFTQKLLITENQTINLKSLNLKGIYIAKISANSFKHSQLLTFIENQASN